MLNSQNKISYEILPFSEDNLSIALSNRLTPPDWIKSKKFHYKFFLEYLSTGEESLKAATILLEEDYISHGYIIDYAEYYSTCLTQYDRTCRRVHFFSASFSKGDFEKMIYSDELSENWESYLGYIIVKPLPDAPIGATVLKTYIRNDNNDRIYTALRPYTINIFGKELKIDSLAFMQQDSIVSACATAALWSSFHKVSNMFQTELPSPIEITKSAQSSFYDIGRILPSVGLDANQTCKAIDNIGLVTELRNSGKIGHSNKVKALIYAYLCMGLPVMLGITIAKRGKHLITLTGYKNIQPTYTPKPEISLWSDKIERFYAHDDGAGPFSRITFKTEDKQKTENQDTKHINEIEHNQKPIIETAWFDGEDSEKRLSAAIETIFIPIHSKVRITFEDIYAIIQNFDTLCYEHYEKKIELVWDIRLMYSTELKKEVRKGIIYPSYFQTKILTTKLPKYIWKALAIAKNGPAIEFIFDATAINTAKDYCLITNILDSSFKEILKKETLLNTFILERKLPEKIIEPIGKHITELIKYDIANASID
jgi:hypothetical protein